ncbi:aminopeptidase N [Pilimelia anulata]|uniref:Aminopeptidase N n=1 Tax=Pilimelia anulata TaxID=53371 RepID=A0A8J3B3T9_9ACTN|nr:aminopeptidase N [Pilimelia anulata]GGJ93719.1 aminopeptidase N [Pilimelia anulata]
METPVAGVRNLTQLEAGERARLLDIVGYDISLDLTDGAGGPGSDTFRGVTQVTFRCAEPGVDTFIEVAADRVVSATLNGAPLDVAGWSAGAGLALPGLAAENTLVVTADFPFSTSGQGLHRLVDPVDGEVYLYSQFETNDAQRVFACFDQPDLKSVYTWHVAAPRHWKVVSNAPVERTEDGPGGAAVRHFAPSARMSTYVTALCGGPYHEVRHTHDGIDMGYFCRASMAAHMDVDDLHRITTQGFDFFHSRFGIRYPLPKYDQVWTPEFNAGAMENFGCVVHAEEYYIFRSQVTDFEYEQRANTILHELAHMWFGDLVTMRWWNDLWLNESFAEWASHWCNTEATRFTDAWVTFLSVRKAWGYRQDQMSSTHPVYCEIPDVEAVEVNFDGITYAKGASVIKQLVAYVGIDAFVAGLRTYFRKHQWGNATFDDLLTELESACGRELRKFAAQWLETAQVNTLRPEVSIAADGTYASVVVAQQAPAAHPVLRTHRLGVGLYDLVDGALRRREHRQVEVAGERTVLDELAGQPAADVLLLNDEDLTYAKLRLDDRSMATVVKHLGTVEAPLARALVWAAAWDMVRDAELPARDYLDLVIGALPAERDINLITATLRQAASALTFFADPPTAPAGWAKLAATARRMLGEAPAGSGVQLAWARAYAGAARGDADVEVLRGWLAGRDVAPGLVVDAELRWSVLQSLVAVGGAGSAEIAAELRADPTNSGEREAALAEALVATAENKERVWQELIGPAALPNWKQRSLLQGFQHSARTDLTEPYAARFFEVVARIWAERDSETAQSFVGLGYPAFQITDAAIDAAEQWLAANPDQPAPLRRLIAEGRDSAARARAARARDARP